MASKMKTHNHNLTTHGKEKHSKAKQSLRKATELRCTDINVKLSTGPTNNLVTKHTNYRYRSIKSKKQTNNLATIRATLNTGKKPRANTLLAYQKTKDLTLDFPITTPIINCQPPSHTKIFKSDPNQTNPIQMKVSPFRIFLAAS